MRRRLFGTATIAVLIALTAAIVSWRGYAQGAVVVRRGIDSAGTARFNALFVREEGDWRMARMHESAIDGDSMADLDWLVGQWKSAGAQGAEIQTTYTWDANKKFLHVQF